MSTATDVSTAISSSSVSVGSVDPHVSLEIIIGGARLASASVSRASGGSAPEFVDGSPFSFSFTGRHDGGMLSDTPSTGHYALLLECVAEAKGIADQALTSGILSAAKKPRVD